MTTVEHQPLPSIGEVRISHIEQENAVAYIMATGHAPETETGQWVADQVQGALADPPHHEDGLFDFMQELIDEYIVPSPHAPITWAATRGRYDRKDSPIEDAFACVIAADIYPHRDDDHFRIASFPIASWEHHEDAVKEALVAMAKQRYAREQLVSKMASETGGIAMPLPGLRLRRHMTSEKNIDGSVWDLRSAAGGIYDYSGES